MRKGTTPGKACAAFLMALTMDIILIAAMMADAGAEVMILIRIVDTEAVITAVMVEAIYDFLKRITWLFYEGGVFVVEGHTKFIVHWAQTRHFFLVDGGGRSVGGTAITDEQKSTALAPMKAWVKLAQATLDAEFPSTGLVHAFGVFALPKSTAEAARELSDLQSQQLTRLATAFSKPNLLKQYRAHLYQAVAAYIASSYKCTYWDAWQDAVRVSSKLRPPGAGSESDRSGDLAFVCKRGKLYLG